MWTSHKTSSVFVRPSFTRHDLSRSVTMSIEFLRATSLLQIENNEPTLPSSNPKNANGSKRPLQSGLSSDYGKCAGFAALKLFRFNLESMIFVTRLPSTG